MGRRRLALVAAALSLAAGSCRDRKSSDAPDESAQSPSPAPPKSVDLLSPEDIQLVLNRAPREQWFGLYMAGKKVGYASTVTENRGSGASGVYAWKVTAVLKLAEGGEARITEAREYARVPPYGLLRVVTTESDDGGLIERHYQNGSRAMSIETIVDGVKQPRRHIAPSRATARASWAQTALNPEKVVPGQIARYVDFDSDKEQDQVASVEVVSRQSQRIAGVPTSVAILRTLEEGEQTTVESTIAAGGVLLNTTIGSGIELRLQEESVATDDVVGFDYVADAVPVAEALGDPGKIDTLQLIISAGAGFAPPDRPDQRVASRPDGRYDVVLQRGPGPEVAAEERAGALAASQNVDSKHAGIVQLAEEIGRGARTDRERVERLVRWVFANLEKDLSTNLSTASQVLDRRVGDCTEHAILLVALARASGIPAREVSGLVYMGDEVQRFGWHAWVEVELDGHWQAVDPSWDEVQANATHVILGVGSDSDWVAAMGSIRIEVAPGTR